jgi:ribonuclease P/MRP protein subunit RPP1
MILTAQKLGFDGLIIREPWSHDTRHSSLSSSSLSFRSLPVSIPQNFFVIYGRVYSALPQRELKRAMQTKESPLQQLPTLHIIDAGDTAYNRWVLTTPGVSILSRMYAAPRQAFDHICAKSAAEHGICVDINLRALISKGALRQKALRQYENMVTLARKYEFGLTISSGAKGYLGICTPREIQAICSLFGMDEDMVAHALSAPFSLLYPHRPVRYVMRECDDREGEE